MIWAVGFAAFALGLVLGRWARRGTVTQGDLRSVIMDAQAKVKREHDERMRRR